MTGIPITNVNNNCSTGSTALYQASNAVKSSLFSCALALGFDRMAPGSLGTNFPDRLPPMTLFNFKTVELEETLESGENFGPVAPRMFANAGQEYCDRYGVDVRLFAKIGEYRILCVFPFCFYLVAIAEVVFALYMTAAKNHRHAVNNPYAQFRNGWTEEEILNAPRINKQLTKFMCSPTSVRPPHPPPHSHPLRYHITSSSGWRSLLHSRLRRLCARPQS